MSLININNSRNVAGVIKSLAVSRAGVNMFFVEDPSDGPIAYLVMTHAPINSRNIDCREAVRALSDLLKGEWSLYMLQSVLNSPVWERLDLTVSAEFQPTWSDDWKGTLNVRTTWQEGK